MVRELVLFEICKDDGGKGAEEGGAFVDGAVMDRIPYLQMSVDSQIPFAGPYRLRASVEYGTTIEIFVVFYSVAVLDDAFSAAVRWWRAAVNLSAFLSFPCIHVTSRTYSSDVSAFGCIWMRMDLEE